MLIPAFAANSVGVMGEVMALSLHSANSFASPDVCGARGDFVFVVAHIAYVADDDRNYLRQWREMRKLSQEALADKVGTTKAVISLLENEKRPLSSKWLRKLAEALGTQPGYILDHDPNELPSDVFELWDKIDERDRAQAARVLRTFATGTDG